MELETSWSLSVPWRALGCGLHEPVCRADQDGVPWSVGPVGHSAGGSPCSTAAVGGLVAGVKRTERNVCAGGVEGARDGGVGRRKSL